MIFKSWKSDARDIRLGDGRTMTVVDVYYSQYSMQPGSEGQEIHRDLDTVEVSGVSKAEVEAYYRWRVEDHAHPNCVPEFMKPSPQKVE